MFLVVTLVDLVELVIYRQSKFMLVGWEENIIQLTNDVGILLDIKGVVLEVNVNKLVVFYICTKGNQNHH
jgi:hypothetical protein